MAILSKGTNFSPGEQVTADKLDALVDSATFAAGAVDNSTTALDGSSPARIIVKNEGISATQLDTDAVTTVKVQNNAITLAKMATQADQTVLGNVSGGSAVPTAVPIVGAAGILINSDSLGTSDTKGATQGNIKAYVDSKGIIQTALASTTTQVSTGTLIPSDDTAPLITEGAAAGLSVSMTPTSTSTTIRATLNARLFHSNSAASVVMALFEDNTCVGVKEFMNPSNGAGLSTPTFYFNSASTAAHTYSVRFGPGSSGTVTLDLTPTFGGLRKATLFLEELA